MVITEKVVRHYSWLVTYTKFWLREFNTLAKMPLHARLKMWSNGYFSAAWYRYEFFKGNNPKEYVSDYAENLKASRINIAKDSLYVDNKVIFPLFFKNFAPIVPNYGMIQKSKITPLGDEIFIDNYESIIQQVEQGNKIVVKPIDGQRGGKVNVLEAKNGEICWNSKIVEKDEAIKKLSLLDNYIICPHVKQSEFSRKFNPSTTNTVRILTMIDPETDKAFIGHAVQRIGTKLSYPVDNFAVGGLTVNIDIESGKLGTGSYIIPTESNKVWYSVHPETGAQLTGTEIPKWEIIKSEMLRIADSVSFLKIIGWDLILTDSHEGFVLLEGNNAPCFKVHQLHGGFLKDERVYKFMKYYNVI